MLAEAHRRRRGKVIARPPSFFASGSAAAADASPLPPEKRPGNRDEGTASVEALAAEVAARAARGRFSAPDLAAVASVLGKAGLWCVDFFFLSSSAFFVSSEKKRKRERLDTQKKLTFLSFSSPSFLSRFESNTHFSTSRSHHLKRAVVQAASGLSEEGGGEGEEDARKKMKTKKGPTAAAAAAVPPAALALLAEAYSHLSLHDDHGMKQERERKREKEGFPLFSGSFLLLLLLEFSCAERRTKKT